VVRHLSRCALLAATFVVSTALLHAEDRSRIGPATFTSVLAPGAGVKEVKLQTYALDREPVTNAPFLAFVERNPHWRRDRVTRLFAEPTYLSHWAGPAALSANARPDQPVTRVSWFAARAY